MKDAREFVFSQKQIVGTSMLIMLVIADWSNDDTGWTRDKSIEEIADRAHLSARQTARWLTTLKQTGDLISEGGKGKKNRYKLAKFNATYDISRQQDMTSGAQTYDISGSLPMTSEVSTYDISRQQDMTSGAQTYDISGSLPMTSEVSTYDISRQHIGHIAPKTREALLPSLPSYTDKETVKDTLPSKNGQSAAASNSPSTAPSEKAKEPRPPRPGDAEYDAIKAAFPNAATGEILMLRGLLCGIGTVKGDWKVNQLDTPLTPEEVIAFGQYRTERARRGNISAPSKPDVLARWVNDWRSGEPLPASTMAKNATTAAPVPAVIPETQTEKFKREQAVALQLALQRQAREDEARKQVQTGKVSS